MDERLNLVVLLCILGTSLSANTLHRRQNAAGSGCQSDQFQCRRDVNATACRPISDRCDGIADCSDGSDECGCQAYQCPGKKFKCMSDGVCIPGNWQCDNYPDCLYGEDETGCPGSPGSSVPPAVSTAPPTMPPGSTVSPGGCSDNEFQCKDGSQCIYDYWECDNYFDCADESDEKDCPANTVPPTNPPASTPAPSTIAPGGCQADEFRCQDGSQCIYDYWECDNYDDCADKSDEQNCPANTVPPTNPPASTSAPTTISYGCQADEFRCHDGSQCIYDYWECDNYDDCADKSDEQNCPDTTVAPTSAPATIPPDGCQANEFRCHDGSKCIYGNWKCDAYVDCADKSDEQNCPDATAPPTVPPPECTAPGKRCDGYVDCDDSSDEQGCETNTCSDNQVRCGDGTCLAKSSQCNGYPECPNGEDEAGCTDCPSGFTRCKDQKLCIEDSSFCDKIQDCPDNSDETDPKCSGITPSRRGMILKRFEQILNELRSRQKRSAGRRNPTVGQIALKRMEIARRTNFAKRNQAMKGRRMESARRTDYARRNQGINRRHMEAARRDQVANKKFETKKRYYARSMSMHNINAQQLKRELLAKKMKSMERRRYRQERRS